MIVDFVAFSHERSLEPWEAFPGWIHYRMDIETDEQIAAALGGWAER